MPFVRKPAEDALPGLVLGMTAFTLGDANADAVQQCIAATSTLDDALAFGDALPFGGMLTFDVVFTFGNALAFHADSCVGPRLLRLLLLRFVLFGLRLALLRGLRLPRLLFRRLRRLLRAFEVGESGQFAAG